MKENDIYEGQIIDDNLNGNGILKIKNFPVFVPFTIKGDFVKVKITKVKKKYAIGEVISYLKHTNSNTKVICPYYYKCGGCNLLHISYTRENELKKNYIQKLFQGVPLSYTYFNPFNYRNKVTLHVKNRKLGFYEEKSNSLINISNCLLVQEEINNFIEILKQIDLSNVKELVIKEGTNKKLLLKIIGTITNKDLNVLKNYSNLSSIFINNNLVYGKEYISIIIDNKKYLINEDSFFQINNDCMKALYNKIKQYVKETDKLLDLYCGTGSIGIFCSDVCNHITGVEVNKKSVLCGKKMIEINNIKNYKIINGDANIIKEYFDVVVVDPPRSGLSKEVIKNLNKMKSKKIIYVSCNPSTLKRDIESLNNYKLQKIDVFNMFPRTKHVECVSLLSLKTLGK